VQAVVGDLVQLRRDLTALYWRRTQPESVTYQGVRLWLDPRWATPRLRDSIYRGYYENQEHDIVRATLSPGDRYLELGAGIGFLATCACQEIGAENVFVYEANPDLIQTIRRTTGDNGFSPHVTNAVLGDGAGTVDFYVNPDFWSSSLKPEPGARRVSVPLRSFSEELEAVRPTYLTVDIEGGETALFDGLKLPSFVRTICLEVHPGAAGVPETHRMLTSLFDDGFAMNFYWTGQSVVLLTRDR
jgi:FkbM family methyltransferase